MPEIRFEAKRKTVDTIDGFCYGTGKCRTAVINEILEAWVESKLREATMVCRVAGINPTEPESDRQGGSDK